MQQRNRLIKMGNINETLKIKSLINRLIRINWQEYDDEEQDKNKLRYTKSLQVRTDSVSVDEQIGQRRNLVNEGLKKNQSRLYIKLCDDLATNNLTWLDHLNSVMHNRLLWMNMKVDEVTLVDIMEKLQQRQNLQLKVRFKLRSQNQLKKLIRRIILNKKENNKKKVSQIKCYILK